MFKGIAQATHMGNLKLFQTPFCQDILGEAGVDVVVFNQEDVDHWVVIERTVILTDPSPRTYNKYSLRHTANKRIAEELTCDGKAS
ncbi:hypothetical protein YTPLAS72_32370 [Nitrospira sp.]|nr:hypothetical protein YTPLAS72_32370 [Nitrospira sp.]